MILLIVITSRPLTCAATSTGTPAAAKATGELLARRQIAAAFRASKPSPTSIAVVMATGVPKPAAPSRNAPKANAMNSASSLLSPLIDERVARITANWPDSTLRE